MLTLFFVIATVICAVGWIVQKVACLALVKYMLDKEYTPPSDEETDACLRYVWSQILHRR